MLSEHSTIGPTLSRSMTKICMYVYMYICMHVFIHLCECLQTIHTCGDQRRTCGYSVLQLYRNYIGPGGQFRLSSLVAETFGLTCLMILPAHGLCIYCLTCILSIMLDALWYVSNNYSSFCSYR